MGLKSMIRDKIPQPWLHVLEEHKVVTKYIDLVYSTHCSNKKPTKEDTKHRITRIKRSLVETNLTGESTSFWYSFNNLELLTAEEREVWKTIDRKIQNYKTSCL